MSINVVSQRNQRTIPMERELNIQELITLYADGGTTPEQERVLFNTIADDSELQREFRTAMKIQSLLTPESDDISEQIDTALFARLGIGEERKKRGLILPLFSSMRLAMNGYQAVGVRWSKAALVLIALGIGVWKGNQLIDTTSSSPSLSSEYSSSMSKPKELAPSISKQESNPLAPKASLPMTKEKPFEYRSSSHRHSTIVSNTANSHPVQPASSTNSLVRDNAIKIDSYQQQNLSQQQSKDFTASSNAIEKTEDKPIAIAPTLIQPPTRNTPSVVLKPEVPTTEQNPAEQQAFQQAISDNQAITAIANNTTASRFSLEARGGQNISSSAGSNVGLNNFSLSAMYRISENNWAGLFVGTSSSALIGSSSVFASSTSNRTDTPDPDITNSPTGPNSGLFKELRANKEADSLSNITPGVWFGAAFEHRFGNRYNIIRPTTRLAVGAWGVRPFSRANVGVAVRILRNVNTTLGFEGTMMYEPRGVYSKGWESGIGGVAGLSVEF